MKLFARKNVANCQLPLRKLFLFYLHFTQDYNVPQMEILHFRPHFCLFFRQCFNCHTQRYLQEAGAYLGRVHARQAISLGPDRPIRPSGPDNTVSALHPGLHRLLQVNSIMAKVRYLNVIPFFTAFLGPIIVTC